MRKQAMAGVVVAAVGFGALYSAGSRAGQAPASTKPAAATSRPVNTMCLVMPDNKIDPAVTYEYKGKVYGFCCKPCIDEFKKDPEKYVGKMK